MFTQTEKSDYGEMLINLHKFTSNIQFILLKKLQIDIRKRMSQPVKLPWGGLCDPIWAKITLDTKKI